MAELFFMFVMLMLQSAVLCMLNKEIPVLHDRISRNIITQLWERSSKVEGGKKLEEHF